MHKVIIPEKVHNTIKLFIDGYREKFLEIYDDTGIYYEKLIKQSYIENSKKFQKDIFDSININLQQEIIGKKILKNNNFSTIILAGNYRLFVKYSEDKNLKIRFVEDIKFHRK